MNLCITGGGTGGLLMLASALLEASQGEVDKVIFIGSTSGQDKKYFEHESRFNSVDFLQTTGVVNQKGFAKFKALYKVFQAFLQARKILKSQKIDAVYSVGGFSSAAASFGALSLGIPLLIHEQNAVMGRLNKLLKPFAKSFIWAYDKNSSIQGYPVKKTFFEMKRVRDELKTIIFLGGSHGAKAINDLALNVAKELQSRGIHIIHQAGDFDFERVEKSYKELGVDVELYGFTKELDKLIAKADFAVSRSGASTLWELTANGCVAFYVPYPYAAGDHQYYNAQFIVEHEMGWCEREGSDLTNKLLEVLDKDLAKRSQKLLQYAYDGVAKKMVEDVKQNA